MLCQNCGRRSSDTKSFCEHCGAVASDDSTAVAAPRPAQSRVSTRATLSPRPQGRPTTQQSGTIRRAGPRPSQGGSSVIPTLIFWGLVAYGAYWFTSDEGRDLRSLLNDIIQQQREQSSSPSSSSPVPAPRPAPPVSVEPAPLAAPVERSAQQPGSSKPAPSSLPPARSSVPPLQQPNAAPPASDPGVEGLSPAQVIQKLGRPASVVTLNGVTGWSYRGGALIVYFVKDRATVKPPR